MKNQAVRIFQVTCDNGAGGKTPAVCGNIPFSSGFYREKSVCTPRVAESGRRVYQPVKLILDLFGFGHPTDSRTAKYLFTVENQLVERNLERLHIQALTRRRARITAPLALELYPSAPISCAKDSVNGAPPTMIRGCGTRSEA